MAEGYRIKTREVTPQLRERVLTKVKKAQQSLARPQEKGCK
jgi:hypothetical protein